MFGFVTRIKERARYHERVNNWVLVSFSGFQDGVLPQAKRRANLFEAIERMRLNGMDAVTCAFHANCILFASVIEPMTATERTAWREDITNMDERSPLYKGWNYALQTIEQMRSRPGVAPELIDAFPYYISARLAGMDDGTTDRYLQQVKLKQQIDGLLAGL
jgi:hypothetical protein